jgi:hypothetical protein
MGVFTPHPGPHRIHTVHRVGAGATGGFLLLFGLVGVTRVTEFLSTSGTVIMGLTTNGLLTVLSMVVGVVLVAAALRGGPTASTVAVVVGGLFLLSGLGNALVLGTPMNMLAFGLPNVVFSIAVGFALLLLGAYGRFTGGLPATSPYAPGEPGRIRLAARVTDGTVERAMAAAERAVAQRAATAEQVARVRAAAPYRTHEDRRRAFVAVDGTPTR